MMRKIEKQTKIVDAIFSNPLLLLIFERMEVYMGYQDKKISDIAQEKSVSLETLLMVLNLHHNRVFPEKVVVNPDDLVFIVNYLSRSHDYFSKEVCPRLRENINRMIINNSLTEVKMIGEFFKSYCHEVDSHFEYENRQVFPYAIRLFEEHKNMAEYFSGFSMMEYKHYHNNIEEKLDDLKYLLIRFLPPTKDMILRRNILLDLFILERDLSIHARIENDILVPMVEQLEKRFLCQK